MPIASSYSYRVLQKDPVTGKNRRVKCYHKLVVVKNTDTQKVGNYVVFFIATNEYSKSNRGIISDWFNNDGNMGDFSGLKIYTNLEGRIIRVNKYVNGQKRNGVYLGGKIDKMTYVGKMGIILNSMRYMKVEQGATNGIMTRSEGGGDSWSTGDFWDIGGGFFYDDNNDSIWYDSNGDGSPDTVWLPDVDVPGNNNSNNDSGEGFPDPDPESGNNDNEDNDDEDPVNQGSNQSDIQKKYEELKKKWEKSYPYIKQELAKVGIDINMYKITVTTSTCLSNARIYPDGTIEICQRFFDYKSDIDRASILWHEIYHKNNDIPITNNIITNHEPAIKLNPNPEMLGYINTHIRWYYSAPPSFYTFYQSLYTEIRQSNDPEWHMNEIKTYTAEINNGMNVSEEYAAEREYQKWYNEEIYRILTEK